MPQAPTTYRRKLIEVALPLVAINTASAREKSMRHGHPSTLHLWWARRPLAACRAVLFAQMVDDPSSLPDEFPTEEAQEAERQRLFAIITEFVKWENTTNEAILHLARVEIARSAARNHSVSLPRSMTPAEVADAMKQYAPPVLDPFAGGGSIPLEAQRLGLEAHASDLNPVAVLINKALIEIPPKFANRLPVNPDSRQKYLQKEWKGAEGLAEDVRYYGRWMRDEAFKRIGNLYPKVALPKQQGGGDATVIAWIWARTVKCPNPACGARMPLVRSFALSTKRGEKTWVEPEVDRTATPPIVTFAVKSGQGSPQDSPKMGRGAQFRCLACGQTALEQYIKGEALAGRMGAQMMAIVAEGKGGRVYLPPVKTHEAIAEQTQPEWRPEGELGKNPRHMVPPLYGMKTVGDLFTPRQLVALTTFSDLVGEVQQRVMADTEGDAAYADAVATYLALLVDQLANHQSSLCRWESGNQQMHSVFARQALAMTWDYVESNAFCESSGSYFNLWERAVKGFSGIPATPEETSGVAQQRDATASINSVSHPLISTDPPYYDNVPYADLSDFFYVWLRRSLGTIYPDLFHTLLTPKKDELVADPFRHGSREGAEHFFEHGLGEAFSRMREAQHREYPLAVYYAFKQTESDDDDAENGNGDSVVNASTGWETMLDGLLKAGFSIDGTWPLRTELGNRMRGQGSNALASSIVLVCRPRPENAVVIDRRGFLQALHRELPAALRDLQRGLIAPVDLAQASIGPGMAVFSRYSKVLESDGSAMRVRTALQLINQTLDEVLAEQEGEYDPDTRWAVAWFEQYGMNEGPYGVAETLSKAKNTAVSALVDAGILQAKGGKVRLVARDELPEPWNPATAKRLTVWEVTQRLIRALQEQGEAGAAAILDHVGGMGDLARDLAYRLYTVCERKKWADEALAYNALVVEWTDISGAAERLERTTMAQGQMW